MSLSVSLADSDFSKAGTSLRRARILLIYQIFLICQILAYLKEETNCGQGNEPQDGEQRSRKTETPKLEGLEENLIPLREDVDGVRHRVSIHGQEKRL